jgi:hypothetical protein
LLFSPIEDCRKDSILSLPPKHSAESHAFVKEVLDRMRTCSCRWAFFEVIKSVVSEHLCAWIKVKNDGRIGEGEGKKKNSWKSRHLFFPKEQKNIADEQIRRADQASRRTSEQCEAGENRPTKCVFSCSNSCGLIGFIDAIRYIRVIFWKFLIFIAG